MFKNGWIKLHRRLLDNEIWGSDEPFDKRSAWVDLLLLANHGKTTQVLPDGSTLDIKAGQMFVSLQFLAERWHWNRMRVKRFFDELTITHSVTLRVTPYGTLITLIKWDNFQSCKPSLVTPFVTHKEEKYKEENKNNNKYIYKGRGKNKFHNFNERDNDLNAIINEELRKK